MKRTLKPLSARRHSMLSEATMSAGLLLSFGVLTLIWVAGFGGTWLFLIVVAIVVGAGSLASVVGDRGPAVPVARRALFSVAELAVGFLSFAAIVVAGWLLAGIVGFVALMAWTIGLLVIGLRRPHSGQLQEPQPIA